MCANNAFFDLVAITFLLLMAQSVFFLFYSFSVKSSLFSIVWVFSFVFYGVAPYLHYLDGYVIWRWMSLSCGQYIYVNLVIFFANLFVFFGYMLFAGRSFPVLTGAEYRKPLSSIVIFILLLVASICLLVLFYFNNFSVAQLFFRGIVDSERSFTVQDSSLMLIVGMLSRLIPVFCVFYLLTRYKELSVVVKLFMLFVFLVAVFPTGVPRYLVAFAYIPLFMLIFPVFRRPQPLVFLLMSALLIVFPFLDQFRDFKSLAELNLLPRSDYFSTAHFDAYENLASVLHADLVTNGYQLLGVLLFFVPRLFWETKPVGSGFELAEQQGYLFKNISMPFFGEGFVNFGIFGLIGFSLLLGFVVAKADVYHRKYRAYSGDADYFTVLYLFFHGALFFILRGDLLSSFSYTVSALVSYFLVWFLIKRVV